MKNFIVVLLACVFLFAFEVNAAESGAASATSSAEAGKTVPAQTQTEPTYLTPFYFTTACVTLFMLVGFSALRKGLVDLNLNDALSEEMTMPANTPTDKLLTDKGRPLMVASTSRLISFMGSLVLVGMLMGFGYYLLWAYFSNAAKPDLKNLTDFLLTGTTIFIPYAVNKLGSALGGK